MNSAEAFALEAAIGVATNAHRGQRDKSGKPYLLHALRVMFGVEGALAQQAAVLHDVVEDTEVSFDDLLRSGVQPDAVSIVRLLTRHPSTSYADYVCRLKENETAKKIKLSDLQDNYRLDRVAYRHDHSESDAKRIQKYILTRQFLCDELTETEYRQRVALFE